MLLSLSGKVAPALVQNQPVANSALSVPSGSTFTATGSAGWLMTLQEHPRGTEQDVEVP